MTPLTLALRMALEGADDSAIDALLLSSGPDFADELRRSALAGAREAIGSLAIAFAEVDTSWVPDLAARYTQAVSVILRRSAVRRVAEAARAESVMRSIAKGRGTGATDRDRLLDAIRVSDAKRDDPDLKAALNSLDLELRTRVAEARTAGALAAGRAAQVGLRFVTMEDERVRVNHAAAEGFVAHARDPVWIALAPPLGWRCRCGLVLVDREELQRRGLANSKGDPVRYRTLPSGAHADAGFNPSGLPHALLSGI